MKTPEYSGTTGKNRSSLAAWRNKTWFGGLALLLSGCASVPDEVHQPIDTQWLLSGQPLFAEPVRLSELPEDDILGLAPEMRAYLAEIAPDSGPQHRLQMLLKGFERRDYTVQYHADKTLTASETYSRQVGNCMAFTVLMVAMARELGANAYFNQVEVPPVWGHEEAQTFVVYRHINMVSQSPRGRRVVDFNLQAYDPVYDQRKISDTEAFAQYYSNRGLELMQQGEMRDAFRYLRKSLELRPHHADLWANLGAFYSRNQEFGAAEESYKRALQLKGDHAIAMSNLERLHRKQQQFELADYYAKRARYHRERNPYYLYYQARAAYEEGDYKSAKSQLRRAIWRYEDDHRFHFLMGLTRFRLGEFDDSRAHFSEAFSLADNPGTQRAYKRKLNYLLSDRKE
ncbi:tetratricopeptide repeat protein [Microbulbifer agarilyticus]|uniref:tetratricopeptide repeat protein n=1 Tax=Microbulbifer agarilyticus TaxID=260552 RepID=UPI001C970947|nr:tetratricopeptide repeat protein [Microbulbifer agarilyticus]MBY6210457.1 tetratricopeptide repeat protein [Microbulbifer agarilyticus]